MKELTIEEKAKRYDKALERAKLYVSDDMEQVEDLITYIFPETKESEDERIRKNFITFFKDEYGTNSSAYFAGIKVKEIIAWLEKQGQTSTKKDIDEVFIERACDAYCNICDTKECVNIGECDWVERFRKLLRR